MSYSGRQRVIYLPNTSLPSRLLIVPGSIISVKHPLSKQARSGQEAVGGLPDISCPTNVSLSVRTAYFNVGKMTFVIVILFFLESHNTSCLPTLLPPQKKNCLIVFFSFYIFNVLVFIAYITEVYITLEYQDTYKKKKKTNTTYNVTYKPKQGVIGS